MRISPLSVVVLIASGAPAYAQLSISWWTADCGGGSSSSGAISLQATIAQPDASTSLSGGSLTLFGGFWISQSTNACPADLDDGSGTGIPDGGVTIDDLLYYLDLYARGVLAADLDDGSGTGTHDGGVTIDDLLYFLTRYSAGC